MKRILICESFTLVRHKQAKNYGAFARLITLASFLFPDPELGLCMQTRLLLGVPCAFVFEQSSSVFVALNVFASISLMPPKKILRLDSSQRTLSTFFNTTAEQNRDTVSENDRETDETDGSCETTDEGASKHSRLLSFGTNKKRDFLRLVILLVTN